MAIAKLSIDLEARLASFEKDMKTMASLSEGTARRIESAFSGLGLLFTGLAGALSVGALKGAFDSYVEGAAALDDFGEIVGSTTEKVSGMVAVAKISGTDLGLLEWGMVKLAKSTALAGDESTDAGKAFAALKLDPEQLRTMDTADQFKLVSDRLAEYKDGAAKTAIATVLLGKSGAQLLPYMKDLAETGDLVATRTTEQGAAAEEYQKNLKRLAVAQGEVAKIISAEVLPVANVFVKTMVDMISGTDGVRGAAKDLAKDGSIQEWAVGAAKVAGFVIDAFDGVMRITQLVGKGLGAMAAKAAAIASLDFKASAAISDEYEVDRQAILSRKLFSTALEENIAKLKLTGDAAVNAKKDLDFGGGGGGKPKSGKGRVAAGERTASFNDYDQQVAQRIAAAIEKTDIVKAATLVRELQKLDELAAAGLDPAIVQAVRDDLTGATKVAADELARLNKLLDETPTGKLEAVRGEMEFLTAALEKGRISEEQYLEAVVTRLDKVSEKTNEAANEMDEFAKSAAKNIQSSLADFLFDPFSEGLDGMAQKFGQAIQRMIAEAAAAQLARTLFGDMGKDGKVGGLFGSLITALGFHEGGVVGAPGSETFTRTVPASMFTRARRYHSGGLVGDEVPAILKKGELVLTKEQQAAAARGGSSPIVININSSTGDPAEIRRSAAAGARAALGVMSGARRYG